MIYGPLICIGVFFAAYYGSRIMLGPPPEIPDCNLNIQSFDLRGVPIYWQIQEGKCKHDDLNYENVRAALEELVKKEPQETWPEATCFYGHLEDHGFVFKYGTDYYDVEDIDCIEPLRQLQKEKEDNISVIEFIREKMAESSKNQKVDIANYVNMIL